MKPLDLIPALAALTAVVVPTWRRPPTTLHVSLNVSDLERSIEFYERLFGRPAAKTRADWAKFELTDPPLVLALNAVPQTSTDGTRRLSHLGLRLPTRATLARARAALSEAGLVAEDEHTVCCYAEQDKAWVTDPDGNAWELYLVLDDEPATTSRAPRTHDGAPPAACSAAGCSSVAEEASTAAVDCCEPDCCTEEGG